MDLRLLDAEPTTDERAAIDAFLGPPVSSWAGADAVEDGHSARGGIRLGRSATSSSPPCTPCTKRSGGSVLARSTTSRAG